MPTLLTQADLESSKAFLVPQPQQASFLVCGGDVTAHARTVYGDALRRSTQQLADGFLILLAAQVPQGRFDPTHSPADIRPGELMVALEAGIHQPVDIVDIPTQGLRGHLAVEHSGGNISVKGRRLPPAAPAIVGSNAHQAKQGGGKGFDLLDFHDFGLYPQLRRSSEKTWSRRLLFGGSMSSWGV